jgi:hypothetical protein
MPCRSLSHWILISHRHVFALSQKVRRIGNSHAQVRHFVAMRSIVRSTGIVAKLGNRGFGSKMVEAGNAPGKVPCGVFHTPYRQSTARKLESSKRCAADRALMFWPSDAPRRPVMWGA